MWTKVPATNTANNATETGTKRCNHAKPLTQNLAIKGRKCDDTHQHCSNTNWCFCPRKPVASKQPTCVEGEREVNKVNGRLTETVRDRHRDGRHHPPITHRPSIALRDESHTLRSPEALRTPLGTYEVAAGPVSRSAQPRRGRSAAVARRRSGSPPPHPRSSGCRS